MSVKLTPRKLKFVEAAAGMFGNGSVVNKNNLREAAEEAGVPYPTWMKKERVGHNEFKLPTLENMTPPPSNESEAAYVMPKLGSMNVETEGFTENLIPEKDKLFVPFGQYDTVKKILESKMFYPTFITGLSGNGKTFSVEQACANLHRKVIRVNFTIETDEDDLIGGFRLVNGETKFFKGPVINAMEKGCILLLDEIDLGNPARIMCLQSILEGKGYFIKKTGEYIKPAEGFTVVATANTKGKGSDDGRFIGTNVLNEAFLERFPVTVEQEYPPLATERKILVKVFDDLELDDGEFIKKLVDWADIIRKTFYDGGVDEIISTRRLVHIAKAYSIFKDKLAAIELCINRFDEDTKTSFRDLYTKVDADVIKSDEDLVSDDESLASDEDDRTPF
jgi:MoxR-like ATPase